MKTHACFRQLEELRGSFAHNHHANIHAVSRAGIIYISTATGYQWRALIATWLDALDASDCVKSALSPLFSKYVVGTLHFLRGQCTPVVPIEDTTYVTNLLRMLHGLMTPALIQRLSPVLPQMQTMEAGVDGASEIAMASTRLPPPSASTAVSIELGRNVEMLFVFAAVWAFGGALTPGDGDDTRARFSDYWRREHSATVRFPVRDTVFDYYLNTGGLNPIAFDTWRASPFFTTPAFDSRTSAMASVTVPTPDTAAITYWLAMLVAGRHPGMLAGCGGVGKTQIVAGLLSTLPHETHLRTTANFNYFTDSRALQAALEAPLEKKSGSSYGPPGSAGRLVIFLDDLNLPAVDRYNTQPAIELLRQVLCYGAWYDRSKLAKRTVTGMQFIAALNPTAGSYQVNPRLQRHFTTLAVPAPGTAALHTILSTFVDGHIRSWSFGEEIAVVGRDIVAATLQLHAAVGNSFRKSATCFHYEFTLRHLSGVVGGLLAARPGDAATPQSLVLLWLHESERVYGDRFVCCDDLTRYRTLASGLAKKRFPAFNVGAFFGESADPLIFMPLTDVTFTSSQRPYERIPTLAALRSRIEDGLHEYNESNPAMDLVLFDDALRHVARIARILAVPSGHALLVGVGGSGKQSLARLASSMLGYRVTSITITGGYGLNELREDLKVMYVAAGVKEESIVFLLCDAQIADERFLVLVNDVMASGVVSDLFTIEETDSIVNAVSPRCKAAGTPSDRAGSWSNFLSTVRHNMHVVLAMSPTDELRLRATRFPALAGCATIDWFQPWPREALASVAKRVLSMVDLGTDVGVRIGVEAFMPAAFESVARCAARFLATDRRIVHVTPKSFLETLKLFSRLLSSKRAHAVTVIGRLTSGLTKLRATAESVHVIEDDVRTALIAAEEKRVVADSIASEVAARRAIVEAETARATTMADACGEIASRANDIRVSAETDLAAAIPAVEAATAALATLDKKDLAACRTMATPPSGVDDVFAAVAVLLAGVHKSVVCDKKGKVKEKDRTWDATKKVSRHRKVWRNRCLYHFTS